MKRILIASVAILTLTTTTGLAQEFGKLAYDFIAPVIYNKASVSNPQVGEIVFDSADSAFYGFVGGGLNQWVNLSSSSTTSLLNATSSEFTPTASTYYLYMGNENTVTLTPGTWRLTGTLEVIHPSSSAETVSLQGVWTTDELSSSSSSAPGQISVSAGRARVSYWFGAAMGSSDGVVPMTEIRKTVTEDTAIYLVPRWIGTYPANARVKVTITAEKIQ